MAWSLNNKPWFFNEDVTVHSGKLPSSSSPKENGTGGLKDSAAGAALAVDGSEQKLIPETQEPKGKDASGRGAC